MSGTRSQTIRELRRLDDKARRTVKPFVMKSDVPTYLHRPKRELHHVAAEVRESYSSFGADELVRNLSPWAQARALGIEGRL